MERTDLSARQAGLSAAKRALLKRLMRGEVLKAPPAGGSPPVARRCQDGPAPLSFAQQRLWFLNQLEPGNPAYHLRALVRLSGPLDPRALDLGLQEIVRRHEILRTIFVQEGGEPAQVILPGLEIWMPLIDLGGLPLERRDAEWRQRISEESGRCFDLGRPPLVRALLGRL